MNLALLLITPLAATRAASDVLVCAACTGLQPCSKVAVLHRAWHCFCPTVGHCPLPSVLQTAMACCCVQASGCCSCATQRQRLLLHALGIAFTCTPAPARPDSSDTANTSCDTANLHRLTMSTHHLTLQPHHMALQAHLEGSCKDVPVVWQASCKRWPIIEDVLWLALTAPQLLLEGI
jgi:hypothetical protein